MRRAVPAAILTLIGLAALASFASSKPLGPKSAAAHVPPPATAPPATAPPATAPPPTGGVTTPPSSPSSPPSSPSTSPSTTAPASSAARTFDGDPNDNPYGTVQVRITVQDHRITNVQLLQMPYDRSRSQYISEQAGPDLQQETLQAQSAQIDLISGATYTSESYTQSLQSALDKAGM